MVWESDASGILGGGFESCASRLGRVVFGSAGFHGATGRRSVEANRQQDTFGGGHQQEEFVHDAQDQFHAVGYGELAVQAVEVRVDGVRGDA